MIFSILKNLQKELSVFLITIAIATAIYLISQSLWQTSVEKKQTAQQTLSQSKYRYYTALDRKRLLKEFEDKYIKLENTGIVGDEQRLNWVDVIEKTTTDNKIPYLKYKIDKQVPVTTPMLTQKYPGISVNKSLMTLEMQLLHEGDLYSVINSLEANAKGLFDIQSCAISRNHTQVESLLDSDTDKNFAAACKLNWYTINKKSVVLPERRRS